MGSRFSSHIRRPSRLIITVVDCSSRIKSPGVFSDHPNPCTYDFAMESEIDSREQAAEDTANTTATAAMKTALPAATNDGDTSPSNDEGSPWVLVEKKTHTQADLLLGHRSDHCPTPNRVTCKICGVHNPTVGHSCTPKCRACGSDHPTTDTGCPARVRPPLNKDRVRKALQQEQQQRDLEHPPTPSSSSQGDLQAASPTSGSASRSRFRSKQRSRRKPRSRAHSRTGSQPPPAKRTTPPEVTAPLAVTKHRSLPPKDRKQPSKNQRQAAPGGTSAGKLGEGPSSALTFLCNPVPNFSFSSTCDAEFRYEHAPSAPRRNGGRIVGSRCSTSVRDRDRVRCYTAGIPRHA
ncbi:hypothetical protein HPB50_015348 [Hyalomma asiaticum]|uniref:Uncharacterized protein n=1 Tax=Hyalomma asiaticum TaxID=266040 RepID=A0ACB7SUU4_HYAAI|nr:hypothetical protein HPB50_015348 [Hyalomma asiaticum]